MVGRKFQTQIAEGYEVSFLPEIVMVRRSGKATAPTCQSFPSTHALFP